MGAVQSAAQGELDLVASLYEPIEIVDRLECMALGLRARPARGAEA